jgi:hypothetical protein
MFSPSCQGSPDTRKWGICARKSSCNSCAVNQYSKDG